MLRRNVVVLTAATAIAVFIYWTKVDFAKQRLSLGVSDGGCHYPGVDRDLQAARGACQKGDGPCIYEFRKSAL